MIRNCSCELNQCEDAVTTFGGVDTSDAEPVLTLLHQHPLAAFQEIGCLPVSHFTGFPSTDTVGKYDELCKDYLGPRKCYGGLPFFNAQVSAENCKVFCIGMGLDISAMVATRCRCGATAVNAAIWSHLAARPQLAFDPNTVLALSHSDCAAPGSARVHLYSGGYIADAVPAELVVSLEQDEQYIDRIVSGEDHEADNVIDHTGGLITPAQTNTLTGYQRKCWPYPNQCAPVGPSNTIDQHIQLTPPAGVPDQFNKYVIVRYVFKPDVDNGRKTAFREAADRWRQATCINLVEQGSSSNTNTFDIEVRKGTSSCSASLGMRLNKFRSYGVINLGWCNDMRYVGSMVHEIGHTLGMNHEQKRPDAASSYMGKGPHLKLFWGNIAPTWIPQYTPDASSYIGSADDGAGDVQVGYAPYDFNSIMHYPISSTTGETIPAGKTTGNRRFLSQGDIEQILDMYNCRSKSSSSTVSPLTTTTVITTTSTTSTSTSTTSTTTTVTTTVDRSTFVREISCDFEVDQCLWVETTPASGGSAWTRTNGRTPSFNTGPSVDHTKGASNGFYIYIEASNPNYPSKTFTLTTPSFSLTQSGELKFWYYMFGSIVGTLELQVKTGSSAWTTVWSKTGRQQTSTSDSWQQAIMIISPSVTQLQMRGTTSTSWSGDMAIDDITFVYTGTQVTTTTIVSTTSTTTSTVTTTTLVSTTSTASVTLPVTSATGVTTLSSTTGTSTTSVATTLGTSIRVVTTTTTTAAPVITTTTTTSRLGPVANLNCDFELDSCLWSETTPPAVGKAWIRNRGQTRSSNTGPSVDHTIGDANGFYIYVEASSPNYPAKAFSLTSPAFVLSQGAELKFWYHMVGRRVGTLEVQMKAASGPWTTVWSKAGSQQNAVSDAWKEATVALPQSATQLQFLGTTSLSWSGDMAVDDVTFVYLSVTTTTTTATGQCIASCLTSDAAWWSVVAPNQVLPKCAWWQCNGCNACASPPSKCIAWCYQQPFGGWKVPLDACAVFQGCSECQFCGGNVATGVQGLVTGISVGNADPRNTLLTTSPPASGMISSGSVRLCQNVFLVLVVTLLQPK
jgi:hypothetical protein